MSAPSTRRHRLARVAAATQVSLILWGWAIAQYPYVVPPTLTIAGAAAPALTLTLVLWALAAGALVLFPRWLPAPGLQTAAGGRAGNGGAMKATIFSSHDRSRRARHREQARAV